MDYFKIILRATGHKTRSIYFHVRKCYFTIWKWTEEKGFKDFPRLKMTGTSKRKSHITDSKTWEVWKNSFSLRSVFHAAGNVCPFSFVLAFDNWIKQASFLQRFTRDAVKLRKNKQGSDRINNLGAMNSAENQFYPKCEQNGCRLSWIVW